MLRWRRWTIYSISVTSAAQQSRHPLTTLAASLAHLEHVYHLLNLPYVAFSFSHQGMVVEEDQLVVEKVARHKQRCLEVGLDIAPIVVVAPPSPPVLRHCAAC
jgi:hypothetical protein